MFSERKFMSSSTYFLCTIYHLKNRSVCSSHFIYCSFCNHRDQSWRHSSTVSSSPKVKSIIMQVYCCVSCLFNCNTLILCSPFFRQTALSVLTTVDQNGAQKAVQRRKTDIKCWDEVHRVCFMPLCGPLRRFEQHKSRACSLFKVYVVKMIEKLAEKAVEKCTRFCAETVGSVDCREG